MARKKHKTAPAAPAAAESTGMERILLPALGALALVAAWLAALGGFSDGTLSVAIWFDFDTVRPWLVLRDFFQTDAYPPRGWRHGVPPYYVPDYVILTPLFAAGLDVRAGMVIYSLLQPVAGAVGWILVCDHLFGKSPARRAAVLLLQALTLLLAAWRGGDFFLLQTMVASRYGSWAFVPWVIWLFLRALDADGGAARRAAPKGALLDAKKRLAVGALLIGLILALASDLVAVSWLLAPAMAALLCLVYVKKMRAPEFLLFAAVLVLCVPLGRGLHRSFGFSENRGTGAFTSINFERMGTALSDLAGAFAFGAARNPAEALAWTAFAVVAVWRGWAVFRRSRFLERFFIPPESRGELFAALLVPLSAAAALGAVVATGNAVPRIWYEISLNTALRYVLPALYFPLFVGWVLLPWRAELFRVRPLPAVSALCAAVVLLSAPKALAIRADALDAFNTPFYKCFNDAANRLGWKGGVANASMTHPLTANPGNPVERMLPVGVLRRGAGQSRFYLDWQNFNRHHFNGDFQFVVSNGFNGRIFDYLPRVPEDRGCLMSGEGECQSRQPPALILDDASIRGAFGDPAEIVECAGMGLYHYDPPIRLDFSAMENPDFAQVGRIF